MASGYDIGVSLAQTDQVDPIESDETTFIFGNSDPFTASTNPTQTADATAQTKSPGAVATDATAQAQQPNLPNLSESTSLAGGGTSASSSGFGGLSLTTWLLIIGAAVIAGLIVKKS